MIRIETTQYPIHPANLRDVIEKIVSITNEAKVDTLIYEEIENIDSINYSFFCNVCQRNCKNGKKLTCEHLFCNKCTEKWLLYNLFQFAANTLFFFNVLKMTHKISFNSVYFNPIAENGFRLSCP